MGNATCLPLVIVRESCSAMTYSSRPKIQVNLILGCSAVPEQWYLNYSAKVHLHKTPDNVQGENMVALETSIPI